MRSRCSKGQGRPIEVLTAERLANRVRPFATVEPDGAQLADEPHPILARDEVRYAGQPVAAVIADSRALAEDGAELVDVEYEPLPAVVDARASEHPLMRWSGRGGDVDAAFADAVHVVSGRYALPRVVAAPIETRGCVAEHDAERDLLTVWCSAQDTHRPLEQLAHILSRSEDSIRVIVPDVGGAFGSKGAIAPEIAAVAAAAIELGRPLKWVEDRFENFLAAYQGRGLEGELELALDRDGRMLGLRARLWADLGGYLLPTTSIPPHTAALLLTGCYDIPAAAVELFGALTHKVPTGPYRGAGRPDAAYMIERLVDGAARALAIDRIELRRRNLVRSFPHRTPLGYVYDSGDYERCVDVALGLARIRGRPRSTPDTAAGTGLALFVERAGGRWEAAEVTADRGGHVTVRSSSRPHGQGHDTTFAQIAAARLGLPIERVTLRFGDSAEVPRGVGSFGSRSVAVGGSAVAIAIDELIAGGRAPAAALLDATVEEVEWDGHGRYAARGRSVSFEDVAAAAPDPGLRAEARFDSQQVFSSGAYAAGVEIERATGRLRVLWLAAVDDAGTVINPLLAHGQVIGGAIQGLGECLAEEAVWDDAGQPLRATLLDYTLLTSADVPPIVTAEVATPTPLNPLGAKGVGEGGAIGSLAAVANAVADALGGIHVDPPYTDEKLWAVLQR
jgi:aerobic carbon-monoxide dehydrogenase large subunit